VGVLDALWRGALAGGLEEAAGRLSLIYKEFREAGASKDLLQEQLLWAAGWVLEPLLERAPGNDAAVALLNLGDVCARLDAPAWGEAAAIRAAAVFSPGTDDWKRAVQVLHRAGALEEATAVAERGLAAKPQDPAMLVLLADLYAEAGKAGPAAQLYRRALQAPGIGPKTRAAIEERLQRTREQAEIPPAAP
jgi:thioredoxin-like negative regulator of GroEL